MDTRQDQTTQHIRRRSIFLHFLLASMPILILLLALWAMFGSEAGVDGWSRLHRATHPGLESAMDLVSDWGNAVFYLVYGAIFVRGLRLWKGGKSGKSGKNGPREEREGRRLVRLVLAYAVVQILVSFLAVRLLKVCVGRPRPGYGELCQPMSWEPRYNSLPSGHTTEITGAAMPLAMWRGSWLVTVALGLFVAVEGFSRIYLGQHHPTDVFFGWLLGSVAGWAIYAYGRLHED